MTDKEVGKIWASDDKCVHDDSLIRKLVADRQTLWWHQLAKRPGGTNPQEALRYALRDSALTLRHGNKNMKVEGRL